jgi:hypothetical protein
MIEQTGGNRNYEQWSMEHASSKIDDITKKSRPPTGGICIALILRSSIRKKYRQVQLNIAHNNDHDSLRRSNWWLDSLQTPSCFGTGRSVLKSFVSSLSVKTFSEGVAHFSGFAKAPTCSVWGRLYELKYILFT